MGRGKSSSGGGGKPVKLITDAKSFGSQSIYGSNAETDEFFQTETWLNSLTPGEESATKWYTGSAYINLNANLRAGDTPGDVSKCSEYQQKQIKQIDSALSKGVLEKPVTLYRGSTADLLGGRSTVEEIQELVGAKVRDKAYVSASVSKNGSFGGEVAYKILVPAGKGHGAYVGNISNVKSEAEYLMKRNTTYQIMGVQYSKSLGKPVVTMQVID